MTSFFKWVASLLARYRLLSYGPFCLRYFWKERKIHCDTQVLLYIAHFSHKQTRHISTRSWIATSQIPDAQQQKLETFFITLFCRWNIIKPRMLWKGKKNHVVSKLSGREWRTENKHWIRHIKTDFRHSQKDRSENGRLWRGKIRQRYTPVHLFVYWGIRVESPLRKWEKEVYATSLCSEF